MRRLAAALLLAGVSLIATASAGDCRCLCNHPPACTWVCRGEREPHGGRCTWKTTSPPVPKQRAAPPQIAPPMPVAPVSKPGTWPQPPAPRAAASDWYDPGLRNAGTTDGSGVVMFLLLIAGAIAGVMALRRPKTANPFAQHLAQIDTDIAAMESMRQRLEEASREADALIRNIGKDTFN